MSAIGIRFEGPLQWIRPDSAGYLFDAPGAAKPGIFVWTVDTNRGECAYYVGEAAWSLGRVHQEHLMAYLGGFHRVYDADRLRQGEKELIWPGMWKDEKCRLASEFLEEIPHMAGRIRAFLASLRIYIAPTDYEHRVRQRVEAALAAALAGAEGDLQDADVRHRPRRDEPPLPPVQVDVAPALEIAGWPQLLTA